MALRPPPENRTRSSSTSLAGHPPLSRRRSTSNLAPDVAPPVQQLPSDSPTAPPPTMLDWMLSRFIYWLHVPQKHVSAWSSPCPDDVDFVLPLSASSDQVTFAIEESAPPYQRFTLPPVSLSIIIVILLLPVSTLFVFWCLSTLPISLAWPHNIADLAQLGRELHGYSQSGAWPVAHVVGVMAISAVWKHAWSIPGSVLWNVLAGALFSPLYATILLTALTTLGSACATLLAAPLGPFLETLFPRAFDMTRSALGAHSASDQCESNPKSSAWVRLSVLRLIGVVPWSGINIACGVCRVSLIDCMLGTFIGCLPWTAVTCQIGDILQTVASTPTPTTQSVSSLLATPDIIFKLIFLSVLSLAPILGRTKLRAMITPSVTQQERHSRWVWVQDWRAKIRRASLSRSRREQDEQQLDILLQEKQRLDSLSS